MNPLSRISDKKSKEQIRRRRLCIWRVCTGLALAGLWRFPSPVQALEPGAAFVPAEAAAVRLSRGDYAGAARFTRDALESAPDNATFLALAGTILLHTGDFAGAQARFQQAAALHAQESIALYGLGLACMAQGNRSGAQDAFEKAEQFGGDRACLLVARRYLQWIGGAQVSVEQAGVPESLTAAVRALEGMNAARQGDRARAIRALTLMQEAIPGDPLLLPQGLLMTFETARPLTTTAKRLSGKDALSPSKQREQTLSGEIQIAPQTVADSVAYVSYELNGQSLGLVNVRPFSFVWDSRKTSNGTHTLTITLFDRAGREMDKVTRRLRVFNAGGVTEESEDTRLAQLRAMLWQALALRPDSAACAYTLGALHRLQGNAPSARSWFLRAAALRPDYRDTRAQLRACGGLPVAAEPIHGGVPTEKVVALTFDDGPKPGMTEPLLDLLRRERVPATFFVIGRHVTANPELTRQITAAGMELANHSYTHRNLTRLTDNEIAAEFAQTQAAIQMVTGVLPRYVRPPGGNWNNRVARVALAWGLTPCFWTVDVYGSEVVGTQQVADTVLKQMRPGSIVLMHNGKMSTLQAMPTIIRELKRQGYAFVTMATLHKRLQTVKAAERAAIRARALAQMRRE
jgi:peptidoglycan/xylan/chitin deacetylase (PgdA/CDA1 family)